MIPIRLGAYGERRKPLAGENKRGKLVILAVAAVFHVALIGLWWIQEGTADREDVLYRVRYFDVATFPSPAAVAEAITLQDSINAAVLVPMAEETTFPELSPDLP